MRMENTSSIAQLQSDWFKFSDLDRASAVLTITQSGISIRKVAAQLHLSESLLRHLLQALQAQASDRVLAQKGKISTNELVRRARAASLFRSPDNKALELERVRETSEAANTICDWLAERGQQGSYGKQILKEVRHEFASRELNGSLPPCPKHAETPLHKIILRSKPDRPIDDNATAIRWHHEWLFRWTYHALPDKDIRDAALDLALQMQPGR
jgi:transposase-like protein